MYYFILDNKTLANADDPKWLKYLYDFYPKGKIEYRELPVVVEAESL
jgi:hypothetical protein